MFVEPPKVKEEEVTYKRINSGEGWGYTNSETGDYRWINKIEIEEIQRFEEGKKIVYD